MEKTSLAIQFDGKARLDFGAPRTGLMCQVQRALVNLGTSRGTDPVYPTRGTLLMKQALTNALSGRNRLTQKTSYAAIDTLHFLRGTDDLGDDDRLRELKMAVADLEVGMVTFSAQFTATSGESIGILEASL